MPSTATLPRRRWLACVAGTALVSAAIGCSGSKVKKAGRSSRANKRSKGPKTMGDLLVGEYIADLKNGPAEKQVAAAKELGNMGSGAKQALPALEALAKDGSPAVRDAAQRAIREIRK